MIFTENLIIREFTSADSRQYFENNQDEQIKKYMPYRFYADENKAREDLECFISNYPEMEMPYYLAIVKTDTNTLVGHIGIGEWDISETERGHEIEYAISKHYRKFHYATEALTAFTPWCKNKFVIDKIYALVNKQNIASCKALLNAGFILCEMEVRNKKRNVYIFS